MNFLILLALIAVSIVRSVRLLRVSDRRFVRIVRLDSQILSFVRLPALPVSPAPFLLEMVRLIAIFAALDFSSLRTANRRASLARLVDLLIRPLLPSAVCVRPVDLLMN